MTTLAILLAQTTDSKGSPLGGLVLFLPLIVLFYFMMIRPQKARARQQMELMQSLAVGDEIETVGGIFGTVRRADDDFIWLEAAPGVELKVSRGAVRRKVYVEEPAEETNESDS